jgi:hypothetical protein
MQVLDSKLTSMLNSMGMGKVKNARLELPTDPKELESNINSILS